MSRTVWVLASLLVASNMAWIALSVDDADTDSARALAARDAEIARLRQQLGEARPRAGARAGRGPSSAGATDEATEYRPEPAPPSHDLTSAYRIAETWQDAIGQDGDTVRRETAFAEARTAIRGSDPVRVLAGLRAIGFTARAAADRAGLREDIAPLVESQDVSIRLAAWQALDANGLMRDDDLANLIRQTGASTRSSREQYVRTLSRAARGIIEGDIADAVLRAMEDATTRSYVIRGLESPRRLSPRVATTILEFARSSREAAAHAALFVLRPLQEKPRAVTEFLIEDAERRDPESALGLAHGVAAQDVAFAGERLRALYDATQSAGTRGIVLRALGRMGDRASRDWASRIAASGETPGEVRDEARRAVDAIDRAPR